MENFGIPNKVYRDNSQPNTPVTLKRSDEETDAVGVLWNNINHNNGNAIVREKEKKNIEQRDSSQSSEDLTMTQL